MDLLPNIPRKEYFEMQKLGMSDTGQKSLSHWVHEINAMEVGSWVLSGGSFSSLSITAPKDIILVLKLELELLGIFLPLTLKFGALLCSNISFTDILSQKT